MSPQRIVGLGTVADKWLFTCCVPSFGGHAPSMTANSSWIELTFNFRGAGVIRMRAVGGETSLSMSFDVLARLTCVSGTAEVQIPVEDLDEIGDALCRSDAPASACAFWNMPAPIMASFKKPSASSIPRPQPRDGVCRWVTTLLLSPAGWPPWRLWAWVARGWCARPCWRHAPSPLSSPAAFYAV